MEGIMKRNICYFIFLPFFVFVSFYGCASYKPTPLPNLQPDFAPYSESIEDVTLACKALSEEECKKYFDRDIIDKGFQPVQMTIVNDTDDAILFHPDGVSLPVCPPEEVAKKCHTSTAGRATAYGVGALFLWPLAVPAIVDGVKSHEANKELDRDFGEKNIEQMVINPHTTHNGVIFVSNDDYQESFTVKLVNKETRQKYEFYVKSIGGEFTLEKTTEPIANISTDKVDLKVDIDEPWTGVWDVQGSRLMNGPWEMKQSGKIVKSTEDSLYKFEGKVSGNQLKGTFYTDYNTRHEFVLTLSSDGSRFEGSARGYQNSLLIGNRNLKSTTNITPVTLNIYEPWTGTWEVDSSGGTAEGQMVLKQQGNTVKSVGGSLSAKVKGNQLEGTITHRGTEICPIKLKLSPDGQSFEGTLAGYRGNMVGWIKGKRTK
jgi:hypothetical protein